MKPAVNARMMIMLSIAKKINLAGPTTTESIIVRGTESLEYDIRRHCESTGQDFKMLVETTAGLKADDPSPIGNIDDGSDI